MRTDIAIEKIRACVDAGGKVLVCGNGGSATMASHFAAELMGDNIPCIALTDVATITAIGNDDDFEDIFSRQVMTLGKPGDVFIGLTTSGKSGNIELAYFAAALKDMKVIRFPTGDDVQAVQEQHLCLLHEIWKGLGKDD